MQEYKSNKTTLYISAFIVIVLVLFAVFRDNSESITLINANKILQNHSVEKVIASKEYVYLKTKKVVYKIALSQVSPLMLKDYKVEVQSGSSIVLYLFYFVLILSIISVAYKWLHNYKELVDTKQKDTKDNVSSMSKPIQAIKSNVTFDDIGGISDVKIELEEIIDFMKNPRRYKNFGARMPRGVLLVGPPGVGKTMIAKAVASAAGVPFYYQSGASFVQIYVGMGAKRVHELFVAAKNNSPSIIFIDEIDAVGKKRDGQRNDEREATLNQLLIEMDGFENSSGVIVVAATNKIDVLDEALLRAGRFDRRIFVELPTKRERVSIIEKYLNKVPTKADANTIANMTVGFNGAALAALVNEAALLSLRQNDALILDDHFHQVKDKVMFGKKKLQMLNDEQKQYRITYQASKVIVATHYDLTFEKLMLSNEKLTPITGEPLVKNELEARVKMLLAGMAGCSLRFNEHASSAKSDLDEAKELTRKMISEYGMGTKLISDDKEQELVIDKLYEKTKQLLRGLQDAQEKVEEILNEKESISKKDVVKIISA
jgi:ATP-dependent metalloprotease FtsH